MKIKSERDFWSGVMFIGVGLLFAVGAFNYSMGPACQVGDACAASLRARLAQLSAHPGAGYFPLGLSILLVILGAVVAFKALAIESTDGDRIDTFAWKPLAMVVIAIVGFGLLIETFGLLLTIPALIVLVSLAGDQFRWKEVVVMTAVLTTASWAVFIWAFKLTIPVLPYFFR